MKLSLDVAIPSPTAWVEKVLEHFDTFLQDHADCERKASAMALSMVAKYPDRNEIIPDLIDTALEELEQVVQEDSRLLIGSLVEMRGAERFRLIEENLIDPELKRFYKMLWVSEAKHGNIYVKMALNYFPSEEVYARLAWWVEQEGNIIQGLPIRAALH